MERRSVDDAAYRKWLGDRASQFPAALDVDRPSIKHLVFLCLLERPVCTYEIFRELIDKHGALTGPEVEPITLRSAASELSELLERDPASGVRISHRIVSKQAQFNLERRRSPAVPNATPSVFISLDPPVASPRKLAADLLERRRLPFYAHYLLPRAACAWVALSTVKESNKTTTEAQAWDRLHIGETMKLRGQREVHFVSFAAGEGIGEIEILRRMLLTEGVQQVTYLAVESSPVLLAVHYEHIKHAFADELLDQRLRCGFVVGSVYDLSTPIARARSIAASTLGITDFLPQGKPTLVSYLGNCLGNDESDQTTVFSEITRILGSTAFVLLGVSGINPALGREKYGSRVWEFFLQTPRYLLETSVLDSEDADGKKLLGSDEFTETKDPARCSIEDGTFSFHEISGDIYRFNYKLKYDLSCEFEQRRIRLRAGSQIRMHSIIKYDIDSLAGFLAAAGWTLHGDLSGKSGEFPYHCLLLSPDVAGLDVREPRQETARR